ncbi:MAG: LytR/AlgR family response regulator transcription factor [Ginsengibacter sp.]
MLKCIAIDDEELALELLEDNISKIPYLQLAAKFNDPLKALQFLQEENIDLVLLDIQMPGLTGLQFIKSFPQKCMYIFITAYEKYALEGYHLNVVDYLLKPVSLDRFVQACTKALELSQLKNKPSLAPSGFTPSYFFINADYSLIKINFADIIWVEGLKDYIKIHLRSTNKPVVSKMSMKSIEEQLPSSVFLRIHKSYIVSKEYVTSLKKSSIFIKDIELPVGDTYKEAVAEYVNNIPGNL